jgi:tetratricopeptide (TPR) repeat protein
VPLSLTTSRWLRRATVGGGVVAMAASLFVVSAALGAPAQPTAAPSAAPAPVTDPLIRAIDGLQAHLKRSPSSHAGWSDLGMAYVQQARLTADPSYYPKAEGAFARSLAIRPMDNANALIGQATLAAARHDFSRALSVVDRALALNDYSATAYGVKTDALTELGRYDDAAQAVQRMLDLRPGLDSLARASYQRELRGDVIGARELLQRASEDASSPADQAFALYYLGELAWNNGDATAARRQYDEALTADPSYLAAQAGQAKALAATDPTAALAVYREIVQQQPQPAYLIELGELLEATGQRKSALEQYDVVRAATQLFTADGANVDLELALFEADHGTPSKALRYATSAHVARPASILVQDAYGWALHKAGREAEALEQAQAAVRLGTRLPSLRYHLGVIEAAVGDKAAARRDLRIALSLNPSFNPLQAKAARALLRSLT